MIPAPRGAKKSKGMAPMSLLSLVVTVVVLAFTIPRLISFFSPERGASAQGKESDYSIQFSPEFNPAIASRDDLGISVVIAMDASGSMADPPASGGRPKYIQAAQALAEVVGVLERIAATSPPGQVIKVGLLTFNENVKPTLPLTVLEGPGLRMLKSVAGDTDRFYPGGKTALGKTIEVGAEWLAQSQTILRSLIIITDGENTEGVEPETSLAALYANRNSATTADFTVSTSSTLVSFIGFDVASDYFQNFASLGARVTAAADRTELARALSSILEADITKLEAPALGGTAP